MARSLTLAAPPPARRWTRARPVGVRASAAPRTITGFSDDRAQDQRNDDDIVGVPDNGKEIGYQVNGRGEVDQQQDQADTDPAGQAPVHGQPAQQGQQVRQQPQGFLHAHGFRVFTSVEGQKDQQ